MMLDLLKRKYSQITQTTISIVLLFVTHLAYAGCSSYIGQAVINEMSRKPDGSALLEFKILNDAISQSSYENWTFTICRSYTVTVQDCYYGNVSDGSFADYPWITLNESQFTQAYLDFKDGFDIVLKDQNGDAVDYFTTSATRINKQPESTLCTYQFDTAADSVNKGTKIIQRLPDGTGNWFQIQANSIPTTPGDTNDGTNPYPYLSVADIAVFQGDTANITISLDAAGPSDASFEYQTIDSSATSPVHYAAVSGTGTITVGNLSTSINVNTVNIGDDTVRDFLFFIYNPVNANIQRYYATITILPRVDELANWYFDENSYNQTAGEVVDSGGNGFNSTSGFNATNLDGKVCNAVDLTANGTTDYLVMDESSLNGLTSLTFSTWIKTGDTGGWQSIIHGLEASGEDEFELALNGNDKIEIGFSQWTAGYRTYNLTANEVTDNAWHHIALTRSGDTVCLYIDGVLKECQSGFSSGAVAVASGGLIVGQEQDSIGGTFDATQDFEGLIDETLVFDSALHPAIIEFIYDNQNAGNNWDGAGRVCPIPPPLANIQFDESDYDGTSGEIVDSSGNSYDATSGFITTNIDGQLCKAIDLTANSNTDYAVLNESMLNGLGDLTFSIWVKAISTGGWQSIVHGMDAGGGDEFEIALFSNDRIYFGLIDNFSAGYQVFNLAANEVTDNAWHQLSFTRSNDDVCLYIDGVLKQCQNNAFSTAAINIAPGGLILGQLQISSPGSGFSSTYDFQGAVDELLIFDTALTDGQIQSIYTNQAAGNNWDGSARTCGPTVDHYEIVHDGTGVTCLQETVTVKACSDAAFPCSNYSIDTVSADMTISGAASRTEVMADFSQTTTHTFNHYVVETIALGLTNLNPVAPVRCYQTTDGIESCNMQFYDSGIQLTATDGAACAGTPGNGGTAANLLIQAVRTDDTSQKCVPLFQGNKTISFSRSYVNPVTGTTQPYLDGALMAANPESRTVTFDANGEANVSVGYKNAGQLAISASYDDGSFSSTDSATFTFAPDGTSSSLQMSLTNSSGDPMDADLIGGNTQTAGDTFSVDIAARCADGTLLDNFVMAIDADISPTGGTPDNGTLSFDSGAVNSSGGAQSTGINVTGGSYSFSGLTFDEVGSFEILLSGSYFGTPITSTNVELGRFIPDKLVISVNEEGAFAPYTSNFVYIGQDFGYSINPELRVTAVNSSNVTTQNYTGAYNRVTPTQIYSGLLAPTSDSDTTPLAITSTLNQGANTDNADGTVDYLFDSGDVFNFTRNSDSKKAPANVNIDIDQQGFVDQDGVAAYQFDGTSYNLVTAAAPLLVEPSSTANLVEYRFGRWNMQCTARAEFMDLPVPMSLEYWDLVSGVEQFVTNNDDSVTLIFDLSIADADGSDLNHQMLQVNVVSSVDSQTKSNWVVNTPIDISALNATEQFASGLNQNTTLLQTKGAGNSVNLILQSIGNPGYQSSATCPSCQFPVTHLQLSMDLSATYPFLQYDWPTDGNLDGAYDDNPGCIATFGLYRGNDRIIYWQEIDPN